MFSSFAPETSHKISTLFETPSIITLVSLLDPRSYVHRFLTVRSIIIPFYEIWGENVIYLRRWDLHDCINFDGNISLSSIGPDEYIMSEAYFLDFLRFALECNFDFVVAWDAPTYVDMPIDLSLKNTLYGIEQLRRIIRAGIQVVGLLNGSNKEQYERYAELLESMGIDSVAVRVSEYLRHRNDASVSGLGLFINFHNVSFNGDLRSLSK